MHHNFKRTIIHRTFDLVDFDVDIFENKYKYLIYLYLFVFCMCCLLWSFYIKTYIKQCTCSQISLPHQEGLMVNVSTSHAVGCGFVSLLGHTKDYQ